MSKARRMNLKRCLREIEAQARRGDAVLTALVPTWAPELRAYVKLVWPEYRTVLPLPPDAPYPWPVIAYRYRGSVSEVLTTRKETQ